MIDLSKEQKNTVRALILELKFLMDGSQTNYQDDLFNASIDLLESIVPTELVQP